MQPTGWPNRNWLVKALKTIGSVREHRFACASRVEMGAVRCVGEVVYPGLGEIPEYHLTRICLDGNPAMPNSRSYAQRFQMWRDSL